MPIVATSTHGYRTHETGPVQLRNCLFNVSSFHTFFIHLVLINWNLKSHMWLVNTLVDSTLYSTSHINRITIEWNELSGWIYPASGMKRLNRWAHGEISQEGPWVTWNKPAIVTHGPIIMDSTWHIWPSSKNRTKSIFCPKTNYYEATAGELII